jgi:hypothetical protein
MIQILYSYRIYSRRREQGLASRGYSRTGDEAIGWRKLHDEEPSINRMTKSRRMRWAGHLSRWVDNVMACCLKAGISEAEQTSIVSQRFDKTHTHGNK